MTTRMRRSRAIPVARKRIKDSPELENRESGDDGGRTGDGPEGAS
jgi:hypothetical protein